MGYSPWGCKRVRYNWANNNWRTNLDSILKIKDITLLTKFHIVRAIVYPVVMYGCESWTKKKVDRWGNDGFELWCLMEKPLEIALDCKEIKPVHPKGDRSWIFIGRTDAEAETPIPWPPDSKSWLLGKDPDARKDWRQEKKGMTEDEMVGWHHRLNGHEWTSSGIWWWIGKPGMCPDMSQTWLSNWTEHESCFKVYFWETWPRT